LQKTKTTISIRTDILEKTDRLLDDGAFPGIKDRSNLIEYALSELFKLVSPKEVESPA